MILTDREISIAIEQKQILLEPKPKPEAYSSTTLDLTLGPKLLLWKTKKADGVEPEIFSPSDPGFNIKKVIDTHTDVITMDASGFVLEPDMFILGWTVEKLTLPYTSRYAARIEGKSSMARLGVSVHLTAPTIQAGFDGELQLEIRNHGELRVRLLPGMRVSQLIFELCLGTPNSGYSGVFSGQSASK